jgi:SPP1 family predicted phage head-tail adaptor
LESGKLKHRVTIQIPGNARNSYGEITESYTTFATVWASVQPLSGREYFNSQQEHSEVSTRIRIRYLYGVVPKMRVIMGSKTYLIKDVINKDEGNVELQLMCKEVIN